MKRKKQSNTATRLFFLVLVFFAAMLGYYVLWGTDRNEDREADEVILQTNNNISNVPQNKNSSMPIINDDLPDAEPLENSNINVAPITISKNSGEISRINTTEKIVVFTFDAGSSDESLDKILAALFKHNIQGTFFVTGKWAEKYPDGLKKMSSAGHEIYNHTYSHPHLTQLSDEDIVNEFLQTETLVINATGRTTKPFFRPPYGERNTHILDVAAQAGYQSVYWTVDALDWEESTGMTAEKVKTRILDNLQPGTIYLMHIGDSITGSILSGLLDSIEQKDYRILSLSRAVSQ